MVIHIFLSMVAKNAKRASFIMLFSDFVIIYLYTVGQVSNVLTLNKTSGGNTHPNIVNNVR